MSIPLPNPYCKFLRFVHNDSTQVLQEWKVENYLDQLHANAEYSSCWTLKHQLFFLSLTEVDNFLMNLSWDLSIWNQVRHRWLLEFLGWNTFIVFAKKVESKFKDLSRNLYIMLPEVPIYRSLWSQVNIYLDLFQGEYWWS